MLYLMLQINTILIGNDFGHTVEIGLTRGRTPPRSYIFSQIIHVLV